MQTYRATLKYRSGKHENHASSTRTGADRNFRHSGRCTGPSIETVLRSTLSRHTDLSTEVTSSGVKR
jgi:hypothetical protein